MVTNTTLEHAVAVAHGMDELREERRRADWLSVALDWQERRVILNALIMNHRYLRSQIDEELEGDDIAHVREKLEGDADIISRLRILFEGMSREEE